MTIPAGAYLTGHEITPVSWGVDFGQSLAGRPTYGAGPDAFWSASLQYVVPPDVQLAWEGFLSGLEGYALSFLFYPPSRYDRPAGTAMTVENSGTYTTTSGSTTYTTFPSAKVSVASSPYSSEISISHVGGGTLWSAGMMFNIGDNMHQVTSVVSSSADAATIRIYPRTRGPIGTSDYLATARFDAILSEIQTGRGVTEPGPNTYNLNLTEAS